MSEIILITSGKGGVGKSSICTMLGYSLGALSKKVLVVEMDFGLRCLDILNGIGDKVVYDMSDILLRRCDPIKAVVKSELCENLYILPAPANPDFRANPQDIKAMLRGFSPHFDYILIDSPAGCGELIKMVAPYVDRVLLVTNPTPVSVRDCALISQFLFNSGLEDIRLIINRVPKRLMPTDLIPDLDAVIDSVGAQLIGVIPEDATLEYLQCGNINPTITVKSVTVFRNISRRIIGEYVDLQVK